MDSLKDFPDYIYMPLEDARDIRLLYVESRSGSDDVVCHLKTYRMENNRLGSTIPTFFALSYVWGEDFVKTPIICDGKRLQITSNLAKFLRVLHSTGISAENAADLAFWVDAICINQNDMDERAAQVRIMRDIYAQAFYTLVWLGDPTEQTKLGWDFVVGLDKIFETHPETRGNLGEEFLLTLTSGKADPIWLGLAQFYSNPWFKRAWIRQEAAVSKEILILFGGQHMRWEQMSRVTIELDDSNVLFPYFKDDVNPAALFSLRRTYQTLKANADCFNIIPLMTYAQETQCSVPTDKLYAMLGITSDPRIKDFPIDYRQSVSSTYTKFGRLLLEKDGHFGDKLGLLSSLYIAGIRPNCQFEIPSWAPQWEKWDSTPLAITHADLPEKFKACGQSQPQIVLGDDSSKISVRGILLDQVYAVAPPKPFEPLTSAPIIEWQAYLKEWTEWTEISEKMAQRCNPYPNGQTWIEAYFQALVVTCPPTHNSTSAASADFEKWMVRETVVQAVKAHITYLNRSTTDIDDEEDSPNIGYEVRRFERLMHSWAGQRKLITTGGCYMGRGPETTQKGDVICVLYGANVPVILRPNGDFYLLVGECYIHGLMYGEGMELPARREMDFELR